MLHTRIYSFVTKFNLLSDKQYGFRKNFSTNRFHYTKIGDSKSKLLPVVCGVPQGSSLSPLLFTLCINDLPLASNFSATLYADDTYMTLSDKSLAQLEIKLNAQMQCINAWLQRYKLSLYQSKTKYLTSTLTK